MKLGTILVSLACVGSAILACSSSDDEADTSFDDFAKSYCTVLVGCCLPTGQRKVDDCVAILRAAESGIAFDKATGDACVAQLRSRPIDAVCRDVRGIAPACEPALKSKSGGQDPGGPCTKRSDCKSFDEGVVACASAPGGSVCQLTIAGKDGDGPCLGTLDNGQLVEQAKLPRPGKGYTCDNAAGLYCNRTTTKCQKAGELDGPCEIGTVHACVRTAYCAPSATCAARVPVGGDCSAAECAREAKCGDDKKCFALKSGGAQCEKSTECATAYCLDGHCGEPDPPGDPTLAQVCLTEPK